MIKKHFILIFSILLNIILLCTVVYAGIKINNNNKPCDITSNVQFGFGY